MYITTVKDKCYNLLICELCILIDNEHCCKNLHCLLDNHYLIKIRYLYMIKIDSSISCNMKHLILHELY